MAHETKLSNNDVYHVHIGVANKLMERVLKTAHAGPERPACDAAFQLIRRITNAGNSIGILQTKSPPDHDWKLDACLILRGVYDAMIQALYILGDRTKADDRGQLYIDHYLIEKVEMLERYVSSPTFLGNKMANSPKRAAAEPQIRAEFNKVCGKFVVTKKGKFAGYRTNWYRGTLRDLSQEIGLETEYELIHKMLSGAVHSSAYAIQEGCGILDEHVADIAVKFHLRILSKLCNLLGVPLDKFESDICGLADRNMFELSSPVPPPPPPIPPTTAK